MATPGWKSSRWRIAQVEVGWMASFRPEAGKDDPPRRRSLLERGERVLPLGWAAGCQQRPSGSTPPAGRRIGSTPGRRGAHLRPGPASAAAGITLDPGRQPVGGRTPAGSAPGTWPATSGSGRPTTMASTPQARRQTPPARRPVRLKVARGGSFMSAPDTLHTAYRLQGPRTYCQPNFGFRCAASSPRPTSGSPAAPAPRAKRSLDKIRFQSAGIASQRLPCRILRNRAESATVCHARDGRHPSLPGWWIPAFHPHDDGDGSDRHAERTLLAAVPGLWYNEDQLPEPSPNGQTSGMQQTLPASGMFAASQRTNRPSIYDLS